MLVGPHVGDVGLLDLVGSSHLGVSFMHIHRATCSCSSNLRREEMEENKRALVLWNSEDKTFLIQKGLQDTISFIPSGC